MARPRKSDRDRRVAQLNLHLTLEEEKLILDYAEASGLFPPEWVRKKVLTGKFPPIKLSPIEASVYLELKKIGVNLNQAVHKMNQGNFPKEYLTIQMELLRLLSSIHKLLVDDRESN